MRVMGIFDRRTPIGLAFATALVSAAITNTAQAFPQGLNDWEQRYGAISASAQNASCQLCHANANGGSPWNAYGWDILEALDDPAACDLDGDAAVSNEEAFYCVESENADGDSGDNSNLDETRVGTQPGWTQGENNTLYSRSGTIPSQPAPTEIGPLDPDGTEPIPPDVPDPPGEEPPVGPQRFLQFVRPGQSIQAAIDRAKTGGWILVAPGTYRELGDPTNGLNITRSVNLIGLSRRNRRVVFENAGNQRNGIVAVPEDRVDCMQCHTSMGPPFPTHEGVEGGLKMREPMIRGLRIAGITIKGFRNNGLFTENVDGFRIFDVHSVDNRNYGIFPTLSKNGIIAASRASGSDLDSGIWVETSENVLVVGNIAEGNVNGFEVSNSDDIVLRHNLARNNTVGAAILLLPDIFDDRPGAKRIDLVGNWFIDNNKPNTARPGSILSFIPAGIGVLSTGVDDSLIQRNVVMGNDFTGIAIADYCATVAGTPFDCALDPSVAPEFLADQHSANNTVRRNILIDNGTAPGEDNPFGFAAADLTMLTVAPPDQGDHGNCYEDNLFETFFSLIGALPACE